MNHTEIKNFAHCPDCETLYLNPDCKYVHCGCVPRARLRAEGADPMNAPRCLRTGRVVTDEYLRGAGLEGAKRIDVVPASKVEL